MSATSPTLSNRIWFDVEALSDCNETHILAFYQLHFYY